MSFLKSLAMAMLAALPLLTSAQVKEYFGAIPDLKVSGKEFVDPQNRPVTLHGVMDTPNDYFNGGRWNDGTLGWPVYNNDRAVTLCRNYFTKVFQAIANPAKGTYCNLFRLHLDPAWTNDPDKEATNGGGENDISRFSAERLRKYMDELYVPIAKDALAHGLYVIMRPPGVFPEDVRVGDAYNQYLITVWDIVSSNSWVKAHAGQIMLELGNEPVRMTGNLADYFQPVVNKIRQNGFTGILLLPGTSYQADYRSYNTKAISDNNYAYAVHNYPGWYGGWDANQTEADFISTFEAQVPIDKKPIVITEVDWSPMKEGAGHWNEMHTQYTEGNFGTWGTGTTNSPAPNVAYKNTQNVGWGMRFKHLVDKHPNISWTLQGTSTFVDMDAYLRDGTVKPAFTETMKAAGYADAKEACSGSCFDWYYQYACGDRIPYGTPNVAPEVEPHGTTATANGNAAFDTSNGHYCFYTSYYSSFIFSDYKDTDLTQCAELAISLGEGTIGYRLDIEVLDKDNKSIISGEYLIGTEDAGTRNPAFADAKAKVYDLQSLLKDYIRDGNKLGRIRLNTVVTGEDTDRQGLYYFTLASMKLSTGNLSARPGSKGTSLADISMYRHEGNVSYVHNNPTNLGGWGNGTITNNNDGSYKIVISEAGNSWEGQFNIPAAYAEGTDYTLTLDIKGTSARNIGAAFQKSEGYAGRGVFPAIPVTTSWNTVSVSGTVTGPDCDRLLLNYGDYLGTLEIKNIQVSYGSEKTTEITGQNIRLGEEVTNGAEVFGAGLLGNVSYQEYADLTGYQTMIIKGTGGSMRVMYNRPATGSCPELNPTLESGEAIIDLSSYPYFHLHSIKAGWGQTVNVQSITLIDGEGSSIEIADYYIAGIGYETPSIAAALADESATVIDVSGYIGSKEVTFASANPNCLVFYKDGSKVGGIFSSNMVRNDYNSAYRIRLQDGYDFRAPMNIGTAAQDYDSADPHGVIYTRDLDQIVWATMALPFELDVEAAGTPEIFVLSGVNVDGSEGEMMFERITEGKIPAGSTIVYRQIDGGNVTLKGSNISQTPEGYNIQPIAGIPGWYTAQTYQKHDIADVNTDNMLKDYDVYYIADSKFWHATSKLVVGAFRSIFLHKKSNGQQAAPRFGIRVSGEETESIEAIATESIASEIERYDAAGRRIKAPISGLNIIRMSDGSVKRIYVIGKE